MICIFQMGEIPSLCTLLPKNDMIGLRQPTLSISGIGLSKRNRGLPNKAQTPLKPPPPPRCVVIRVTCTCAKPLLDLQTYWERLKGVHLLIITSPVMDD